MKTAKLLSLFVIVAAAPSYAALIGSYNVSINSSSLPAGTMGFIDLAFNGGYTATAAVDSYSMTGGSLNAASITTQGTVAGTLPGTVTLANNNADYDEGLTFGSSIKFHLTFSGTPSGTTGDVFTLSFFNSSFSGGLLTGNVNDFWIAQFQLDTKGNVTPVAYASPTGGASLATITAAPTVPEPATGLLVMIGLLGAALGKRRKVD